MDLCRPARRDGPHRNPFFSLGGPPRIPKSPAPRSSRPRPMRVLVVDDDAEFRDELVDLLQRGQHTVVSVASAGAATKALEQDEFDVMFTDIRMGRQSGMDLLAATREKWPRV